MVVVVKGVGGGSRSELRRFTPACGCGCAGRWMEGDGRVRTRWRWFSSRDTRAEGVIVLKLALVEGFFEDVGRGLLARLLMSTALC